jgi:hypothetical protein
MTVCAYANNEIRIGTDGITPEGSMKKTEGPGRAGAVIPIVVSRLGLLKLFGSLFGVEPMAKYWGVVARGMCRPTDTATK